MRQMKISGKQPQRQGFVLPLSVLLVLILTISGTGFLQLDYLERRVAMNEVDNHAAFYIANAGLERGRGAYRMPPGENPNWTPVLDGTNPAYPLEVPPDPILCDPTKNCVEPPFGPVIDASSPEAFPFDAEFGSGEYHVRAFNDDGPDEDGDTDSNGVLIIRALGTRGGEQKVLEARVVGPTGLRLINCGHSGGSNPPDCPTIHMPATTTLTYLEGRDPKVFSPDSLPTFRESFYRISSLGEFATERNNFPWVAQWLSPAPGTNNMVRFVQDGAPTHGNRYYLESNTYYFIDADVDIARDVQLTDPDTGIDTFPKEGIVIFSTGVVDVGQQSRIRNSIIIGLKGVKVNLGTVLTAPSQAFGHYPVVVGGSAPAPFSTVDINLANEVTGTVYAGTGDIEIKLEGTKEGVLIAKEGNVVLRLGVDVTDAGNLAYYNPMKGFDYHGTTGLNAIIEGSWRELE